MIRVSLYFAFAATFLPVMFAAPAVHADKTTAAIERCVRQKLVAIESEGMIVPNKRAIRALCRQIVGDDTKVDSTTARKTTPGENPEGGPATGDTATGTTGSDLRKAFCRDYAASARELADFGAQYCDLSGPRYSLYNEDHEQWCNSVDPDLARSEQRARTEEVNACKFCRQYADRAIKQFGAAAACLTPVKGPLWQPYPYEVHFNWCFVREPGKDAAARPEAFGVAAQRNADLEACVKPLAP